MPRAGGAGPRAGAAALLVALALACRSDPTAAQLGELERRSQQGLPPPVARTSIANRHRGPPVAPGGSATARFTALLAESFDAERAMETVRLADRRYREPANEGFEEVLDHVAAALRDAGFGADEGLTLETIATPREAPAWTPRRARLALTAGGGTRVLHAFEAEPDADRTMLPRNAPSARVEGPVVLRLEDVTEGAVLAGSAPLSGRLLRDARDRGAAAVLSASLARYNVDPTGRGRHLDAIQYRSVGSPAPLPVAQISPRSLAAIEAAVARGGARIAFEAEVALAERPLRTLVATVVGARTPERAVAVAAHVQEPGACDNASGVAALLEVARGIAGRLADGRLERPARSLVLVWGDEMTQSRVWLDSRARETVAALSLDMAGESREQTGAIALLERPPDPGALRAIAPDEHTAWTEDARPVDASRIVPTGIAVVARCALVDVGSLGEWDTSEHPYEGGSDHDVFLGAGVPAALLWHFPDFAYHTSLDRIDHVDPAELRRTAVALGAAALALADPRPGDLDRYVRSLQLERDLRARAAIEAGDPDLATRWNEWATGARRWLRTMCLGDDAAEPGAAAEPRPPARGAPR